MTGRELVLEALIATVPNDKCAKVLGLASAAPGQLNRPHPSLPQHAGEGDKRIPGRPPRPLLISPRDVPRRGLGTVQGRAALVHAVAHIEFNAINLALDACWRFGPRMPAEFSADWLSVAADEARHFRLLQARLSEMGHAYGDFEAHNGLWEAAEKTAHDVLERMALVPRVLEARGLDVTPGMIARLREVGDLDTVRILEVILREEVRHVAIGTRWFRQLCAERGCEPNGTFMRVLAEHRVNVRPPLNREARGAAGFDDAELNLLLPPQ